MNSLFCFILLCALASLSHADYCQENFTLVDLPGGWLKHSVKTILKTIEISLTGCSKSTVSKNDVKFFLYTRERSNIPVQLDPTNLTQIKPNKPIILLIHGWLCSVTNDRMPELKNAYLKRYDANVIGVDWSAISIDIYPNVYCNIPSVAEIVGNFLCNLNSNLSVDLGEVHLLGHSMGGQISGLTGQEVQKQCNKKIGRITGLDPAGPFYQFRPESKRLDASDALFVDVIHTNMGVLGYAGTCGTADFFPNCGLYQPSCLVKQPNENIIQFVARIVPCSHLRAVDYMVESINSNNFIATSCELCPTVCPELPFYASHTNMGEDCPSNTTHRKYELYTNNKPPYGQG